MHYSIWYYVWVFAFGLCFGSFFNVCIYRLPRKKSIVTPSSFCPGCSEPIRFYDNIPLVSYLVLGARCRHCGMSISSRYPFIEILTGLLFVLLFLFYGLSFSFFLYAVFIGALVMVTFIDFDFKIIPDVITLPLLGLGFMVSWIPNLTVTPMDSFLGILVGGGFLYAVALLFWLLRRKEGMGGGDIKLMAMAGAFLGPWKVLIAILIASSIGSIIGILYLYLTGKGKDYQIPFGPYLAFGSLISLFAGNHILQYLFPVQTIYF